MSILVGKLQRKIHGVDLRELQSFKSVWPDQAREYLNQNEIISQLSSVTRCVVCKVSVHSLVIVKYSNNILMENQVERMFVCVQCYM